MDAPIRLYRLAKKAPKQIKRIAYYNVFNFWASLVVSFSVAVIGILVLPAESITFYNFRWSWILIAIISLNYYLTSVNIDFINGSIKSYWILFVFFAIQCVGFQIGNTGFDFELGGIPATFRVQINDQYLKINIAAVIVTFYLFSIKNDYLDIVKRNQ